jgi:cytochrome c553
MIARLRPLSAIFLISCLGITAAIAGEPEDARLLASQCAQCHGTNGAGMETLAGKSYGELVDELIEMKQKTTELDIMHLHARGYSDGQIDLIARYFSELPPPAGSSD